MYRTSHEAVVRWVESPEICLRGRACMRRTLIRLVEYALEHARVPDKIIFQFSDKAGGDDPFIPTRFATEMANENQMPTHSALFE